MLITRDTEIRRMATANLVTLAQLLDKNQLWEEIMEVIPYDLKDIEAEDLLPLHSKIKRKYRPEDTK